ncbi:hypothetical protein BJV77DRAFT_1091024 [Russula vinacea]|nr:hypothetical protein BJV77DRAFT_1091024 [Russula vinacea]
MVYINSWQKYQEAAENCTPTHLESAPPGLSRPGERADKRPWANGLGKTRYSVKWRSSEGKLVLKITDDVTCLKFKTHSSIFLGRFEALNRSLIQKMMNSRPAPAAAEQVAPATPQPQATSKLPSTSAVSTGGGVKKKKGKKK